MKIQEINSFLAVCKYGSFTKAAEKIYTTQPTISWHISSLEKELGMPLIVRRKVIHQIALTKAGEAFLPQAKKWAELWRETEILLSQSDINTYHFGCVPSLIDEIFPLVWQNFHRQFEDCALEEINRTSFELFELTENGNLDAALTCITYPTSRIHILPLASERLLFVCREDADYGDAVKLADLDVTKEIRCVWTNETDAWERHYLGNLQKPLLQLSAIQNAPVYFTGPQSWGLVPATYYIHKFREGFRTCELDIEPAQRVFYLISKYPQREPYYNSLRDTLADFFSRQEHVKVLI